MKNKLYKDVLVKPVTIQEEEQQEEIHDYRDFIDDLFDKSFCKRCYRSGHIKKNCENVTFLNGEMIPYSHDIKLKILSIYHWFGFQ